MSARCRRFLVADIAKISNCFNKTLQFLACDFLKKITKRNVRRCSEQINVLKIKPSAPRKWLLADVRQS